ncbi:hypothetical protein [Paenibacillus sp. FSL M7-0896]|uniref:hypothetical protein n=1 Tax=Paenibacillus sp. FSL M7-0896 TaxID=2921610 RepID=UPI0030D7CA9D
MDKNTYIEYLRNQAYWMEQYAKDLENGEGQNSWWTVDFPVFRPDELQEEAKAQ